MELHLGGRGFQVLRAIGYNGDYGGEVVQAAWKWVEKNVRFGFLGKIKDHQQK